jgi:hypothetical protein
MAAAIAAHEGLRHPALLTDVKFAQGSPVKGRKQKSGAIIRRSGVSPVVVWSIIFVLLMALAYYVTRMSGKDRDKDGNLHDTGMAILEFGRAFPNEAIRTLHVTANGESIFVRLHDNKAGFLRSHRNHYACFLIEPGRVRVAPLPNAKGFTVEFLDASTQNGTYLFSTEKEAAEVALWLLDNYVSVADRDLDGKAETPTGGISPDRAN